MSSNGNQLSRRERQVMDILFERGEASARDIHAALPEAPSYSAVRALLAILVDKGHARYRTEGPKYVYSPMEPVVNARQGALRRLIKTFFGGSTLSAANALLGMGASSLEEEELDQLARLIERERAKRRE